MRANEYPFNANTERALLATCRKFDYECCHIFLAALFHTRTYIRMYMCMTYVFYICISRKRRRCDVCAFLFSHGFTYVIVFM